MLRLPPLNALKSFESAARTGSFVAASAELNVTPAAVSQQVRKLEAFLRRKLFARHNNRVVLTDAGQAILAGISPALEDIAAFTQGMVAGSSRARLAVSVIPSLAEGWFMPVLAEFATRETGVRIDLRIEDDPVDFAAGEIDLRITYGNSRYAGLQSVALFRDRVQPVCAPELAARLSLHTADDSHFIHTNWGVEYASHPTWDDWFARSTMVRRLDPAKGHRVGSSELVIEFARRGLGIALGQIALADEHLHSGRLVTLSEIALPLGDDYCAIHPRAKLRKAGFALLMEHLRTRALRQ